MEIFNLIIVGLLVPLAIYRFRQTPVWLAALVLWLIVSVVSVGLFKPISLALILLVIYVSLISLTRGALAEIRYIRQYLRPDRFRSIIGKSLLRWLLFPVVALIGYLSLLAVNQMSVGMIRDTVYSATLTQRDVPDGVSYACSVDNKLICECVPPIVAESMKQVTPIDCPLEGSYALNQAADRSKLERDIHFAVDRFFNYLKADVRNRVKRTLAQGRSAQDSSFGAVVRALFDGSDEEVLIKRRLYYLMPELEPPECKDTLDPLFKMGDCLRNELYSLLNAGYENGRRGFRSRFISLFQRAGDAGQAAGRDISALVDDFIENELEVQRREAHLKIGNWFEVVRLTDLLSFLIWLGMVLLAGLLGFFYVFFRLAYDPRNGNVPLRLLPGSTLASSVVNTPLVDDVSQTDLSIDLDDQSWFLNRTRYIDLDSREDFRLPQGSRLFFRRFPNRLWMRHYHRESGCSEIGMNFVGGGTQVVRVKLGEKDRVVFALINLIGFMESTRLCTRFSWKLAYLLNRSPFFCCAAGPGELLLSTRWQNSAARVNDSKEGVVRVESKGKANPRDIALLDLNGQYSLNVSQSLINVYWDDHSVEGIANSVILRDRQRGAGKANKAAGFVRKLLLVPLPVLSGVFLIPLVLAWLFS